jgi:hypothetical protein
MKQVINKLDITILIIPQVERFASKVVFSKLTTEIFRTVLNLLGEKAESPTGNTYVCICNERLWYLVQDHLAEFLAHFHTDGAYLWSMKANDYVKVGATYNAYEYGGKLVLLP